MNTFFVLTIVSAGVLAAVPVYLVQRFRSAWKMERGLFLRAGVYLIVLEIFHFSVMSQLLTAWPDFTLAPLVMQAAVVGIGAGLFFELGRFLVLDKFFKAVRSYREAVYFALGWNGVATFFLGFALVIGALGINMLISTENIEEVYPNADKEQLEQLAEFKTEANELVNEQPYLALAPILERGTLMLMDIALTLIILFGFAKGTTVYTWYSVLFHALFVGSIFAVQKIHPFAGELLFLVFAALAYTVIRQIKRFFPYSVVSNQQ